MKYREWFFKPSPRKLPKHSSLSMFPLQLGTLIKLDQGAKNLNPKVLLIIEQVLSSNLFIRWLLWLLSWIETTAISENP